MGHNEQDNPSFTSPLMYKIVKNMTPVRNKYRQTLLDEGIDADKLDDIEKVVRADLEKAYGLSKTVKFTAESWDNEEWEKIKSPTRYGLIADTGVDIEHL